MTGKRGAAVVLAIVSVLGGGCGTSKEKQAFDSIGNQCRALVGQQATVGTADAQFYTAAVISPLCCPAAGSLKTPIGGNCPVQSLDNPECSVYYEWEASDPSLCSVTTGGCCFICEVRVMKAAGTAQGVNTPICASRWLPGQACQLPVCQ
jgi:hypothetical protein